MMQDRIADVTDQFNMPQEIATEDEIPEGERVRDDFIVDVIG